MKKKVFIIVSIIILIVLIISLLIWIGYEKYLDENYSAIATVVSNRARFFCLGLIKEIGKVSELFGEHR